MGVGYVIGVMDTPEKGVPIPSDTMSPLVSAGFTLGHGTNNKAEYHALITALRHAVRLNAKQVYIVGDSQLVLHQLANKWRVKSPGMVPLAEEAKSLLRMFRQYRLQHVPRERNTLADGLSRGGESLPSPPKGGETPTLSRHQWAVLKWAYVTNRVTNTRLLARIYGISDGQVWNVVNGKTHTDLTEDDLVAGG